ncbi:MAG: phosphatase PAP2 family protein [Clostridiales bacterium]|jgi:membrane-associated phospholipid phosphatase|nr:phosphatase PAP2 family protein [Clostridiales bacterium]
MILSKIRQKRTSNIMLCLFGLVNLWFFYIEGTITSPTHYMYSPVDDLIPFVPVFILPYYIWYLYQAIPMIYFYFRSDESFQKLMLFSVLSFAIANTIYMIYPNGIFLRPVLSSLPDNIWGRWVEFTYLKDTPINSAPSLHVLMSIAMHLSIVNYPPFRKVWIVRSSAVLMVIICASTVFVKQHSIIDVILSCGIGFLLYLAIYRRRAKKPLFA